VRTSEKRPPGHVSDWPLDDKNAFMALVLGIIAKRAAGRGEIEAAHAVADEIGLAGGQMHWMVDDALASTFHLYYLPSSDIYADAPEFLKWAEGRDLEHIGPDAVAWARVLAKADADH
jgi:hypothetical protein